MKQITILFLLIVQSAIAQNSLFNQVEAKNIGPTIMSGRAGFQTEDGKWSNVVYLRCDEETGFIPELPQEKVDIIYLCNPNNKHTTYGTNQIREGIYP